MPSELNKFYDAQLAERPIMFIENEIYHTVGKFAGQPFILQPWQKKIIRDIFGWQTYNSDGEQVRLYREVFIYIPRKNGKTPLVAAILCYILFCEAEVNQQNFIASSSREQAGVLFDSLSRLVKFNPRLDSRSRIYGGNANAGQSKSIRLRGKDASYARVLSADSELQHGHVPHCVIFEELHTLPDSKLVNVMKTALSSCARKQPLFIEITTADYDRPSYCNDRYNHAKKVLSGERKDERFYPVVYELSPDDDINLESNWHKANPNLGISVSKDYFREEIEKSKHDIVLREEIKRLNFNIKTQQYADAMPMSDWLRYEKDVDAVAWRREWLEKLKGKECALGLDLATYDDLLAIVAVFRLDSAKFLTIPWFFVPVTTVQQRSKDEGIPYDSWEQQGFVFAHTSKTIDFIKVEKFILELKNQYKIRVVHIDPAYAKGTAQRLQQERMRVVNFPQTPLNFSPVINDMLASIANGNLLHGNNPVLNWQVSHAKMSLDSNSNKKFNRRDRKNKVDGLVALAMAFAAREMLKTSSVSNSSGINRSVVIKRL